MKKLLITLACWLLIVVLSPTLIVDAEFDCYETECEYSSVQPTYITRPIDCPKG